MTDVLKMTVNSERYNPYVTLSRKYTSCSNGSRLEALDNILFNIRCRCSFKHKKQCELVLLKILYSTALTMLIKKRYFISAVLTAVKRLEHECNLYRRSYCIKWRMSTCFILQSYCCRMTRRQVSDLHPLGYLLSVAVNRFFSV